MAYAFDNNTPIYLQLQNLFRLYIVTGRMQPGERMPTVRDIAVDYGVNPNTVQRALTELERDGLAFSERTSGRFITQNSERIEEMRLEMAGEIIHKFIADMQYFGYHKSDVCRIIDEHWRDEHGTD